MFSRLVATDSNFQAVYDIIMIHFVLFILYMVVKNSLQEGGCGMGVALYYYGYMFGRLFLDMSLLSAGFGSVSIFFTIETYLLVSFLLVHPAFKVGVA